MSNDEGASKSPDEKILNKYLNTSIFSFYSSFTNLNLSTGLTSRIL